MMHCVALTANASAAIVPHWEEAVGTVSKYKRNTKNAVLLILPAGKRLPFGAMRPSQRKIPHRGK
jgi:hypothetical protein